MVKFHAIFWHRARTPSRVATPALERAYTGPESQRGWEFAPDAKISWNFTKVVAFGLEYYSGLGSIDGLDPFPEQSLQFVPAFDLDVSPKWEINFGRGVGVTRNTDHMLFKTIIGQALRLGRRRRNRIRRNHDSQWYLGTESRLDVRVTVESRTSFYVAISFEQRESSPALRDGDKIAQRFNAG